MNERRIAAEGDRPACAPPHPLSRRGQGEFDKVAQQFPRHVRRPRRISQVRADSQGRNDHRALAAGNHAHRRTQLAVHHMVTPGDQFLTLQAQAIAALPIPHDLLVRPVEGLVGSYTGSLLTSTGGRNNSSSFHAACGSSQRRHPEVDRSFSTLAGDDIGATMRVHIKSTGRPLHHRRVASFMAATSIVFSLLMTIFFSQHQILMDCLICSSLFLSSKHLLSGCRLTHCNRKAGFSACCNKV